MTVMMKLQCTMIYDSVPNGQGQELAIFVNENIKNESSSHDLPSDATQTLWNGMQLS
jgi:hypothetical protein